jgi:hypothetical protein
MGRTSPFRGEGGKSGIGATSPFTMTSAKVGFPPTSRFGAVMVTAVLSALTVGDDFLQSTMPKFIFCARRPFELGSRNAVLGATADGAEPPVLQAPRSGECCPFRAVHNAGRL